MTGGKSNPRRRSSLQYAALLLIPFIVNSCSKRPGHVIIASKAFTESVILGEIAAQRMDADGIEESHRRELGGTRLVWDALVNGQIDAYPEYTGTLTNEIFASEKPSTDQQLLEALAIHGVAMTRPLGFNDTYALGMREDLANRLEIRTISDLAHHPELKLGF